MPKKFFKKKSKRVVVPKATLKKQVKNIMLDVAETKRKDIAVGWPTYGQAAGTGAVYLLNGVANGNYDYTRIGNSVQPQKLTVNLNLESQASHNIMRVIIFQYDSPTSSTSTAVPDMTDILEDSTSTGLVSYDSGYRLENQANFKIMLDKYYTINSVQENIHRQLKFVFNRSKLPKVVQYNDTNSTTAGKGSIYMLLTSFQSGANASGTGIMYRYNARFEFKDL